MGARLLAASAAMALTQAAMAQDTAPPAGSPPVTQAGTPAGEPARTSYDAAFFKTFSPANALQMVQRLPGFSLDSGNSDVRGFGQAAGNVVINGQRPSSKSDALDVVLSRIPASRVLRIELAPGAQFGSDYSSKPQVANVVLTGAGGIAGTIEGKVRREFLGTIRPEGSVSALVKRGPSTFNVSLGFQNSNTSEEGYDRISELPSGKQTEFRLKTNRIHEPIGKASVGWALDEGKNRTINLNASINVDDFKLAQTNNVLPTAGDPRHDFLSQDYLARTVEVSGDITRPFLGGGIKLVGLATRRFRNRDDVSLQNSDVAGPLGGFLQNQRDFREESVARLAWTRPDWGTWSVEVGAEGAINKLRSNVTLDEVDGAGARSRIDLPIDDAVVTEWRGEAFVNLGHDLARNVHLDLGLTGEASHLTVTGDVKAARSLQYLKPKATLDWRPGRWHAQLSIQRTVAQLNFEDFISVAELSNDRVNGGNADLLPQRAWEFLANADRTVLGDGRIKVELGYTAIEQVQDRIPTPEGFDAPGNLGNGHEIIARTNIDLPLARLGIKGGRFSLYGSYVKTSVVDPYTLASRAFSGNSFFYGNANFRQDLGKFAWGVGLEAGTKSTVFRRDELDTFYNIVPFMTAFAEYRPSPKTTFAVGIDNFTDGEASRFRQFFAPDRRTPLPYLSEFRSRHSRPVYYISVKHSFG